MKVMDGRTDGRLIINSQLILQSRMMIMIVNWKWGVHFFYMMNRLNVSGVAFDLWHEHEGVRVCSSKKTPVRKECYFQIWRSNGFGHWQKRLWAVLDLFRSEQEAHEWGDVLGDRIGRILFRLGALRSVQFTTFVRLEVECSVTAQGVGGVYNEMKMIG